jgi:YfiH family protein
MNQSPLNKQPHLSFLRPDWPAPAWVEAFTTLRQGGVSTGSYASLNVADHVGDDQAAVRQNRALLRNAVAPDLQWFWMAQQHTTRVLQAPQDFARGADASGDNRQTIPIADGMWTAQPGLVMTTLTADCMPVLFCHTHQPIVAAVHAGWKGLLDGILEQTLQTLPGDAKDYLVWIGPSILQANFEVSEDFRADFVAREPSWQAFFTVNLANPSHWLADLPAMAESILCAAGVQAVYQSGLCTYQHHQDFYSYRRQATTGRMVSGIWIDPSKSNEFKSG